MRNRLTIFLLIALVITASYSLITLHSESDDDKGMLVIERSEDIRDNNVSTKRNTNRGSNSYSQQNDAPVSRTAIRNTLDSDTEHELPISIKLLGIDEENFLALFEALGELKEYQKGDEVFGYPIVFTELKSESATLSYESKLFEIKLEGANLMKKDVQKSYEEFLAMTPEQVGTRPKVIEHIVSLTKTPFIADGMIASPGINPALFEQAGLEEDDVLKTINGLSVTIDEELKRIQRLMPLADTLVLVVERRGKKLTLYLDIPGEELQLKR